MGQIAYGQVPQYSQSQGGNGVGFFFLRDDGDEAIVRIMHDSPATFEIVAVHPYQVNGKFRNINCIRDPQEEIEKCPLCEAGVRLSYRFFLHLIEYTKDAQGNIIATPKVWERGVAYADTIKDYCAEYAPLSNYIFKIKRNGKKGSQDTTYNIMPANPNVYRPDLYPKDDSLFEGYSVIGTAVYNTDYNGLQKLLVPSEQEPYIPRSVSATPVNYQTAAPAAYKQPAAPQQYQAPQASQPTYEPPVGYQAPQVAPPVYTPPQAPVAPQTHMYQQPAPSAPQYEPPVAPNPGPAPYDGSNSGAEFVRPRRFA